MSGAAIAPGARIGMVTVLSAADPRGGHRRWRCRCDCGNIVVKQHGNLQRNGPNSCGCSRLIAPVRPGERFGMLVAIEKVSPLKGHQRWRCRCDCGAESVTSASFLRRGNTKSCGCRKRPSTFLPSMVGKRVGSYTVVAAAPTGAKGQRRWVCRCDCGTERTLTTGSVGQLTEASACKRCCDNDKQITYSLLDENVTMRELAEIASVPLGTMRSRIDRGEAPETAICDRVPRVHTLHGKPILVRELAAIAGVSESAAYNRLWRGMTPEELVRVGARAGKGGKYQ